MNVKEFNALDYQGKHTVTNNAVCIGGRSDGEHMVLLYQLNGFYIEVYYNRTHNYISAFHSFDDMAQLDPYLEKMEISISY
jgi:hypothetical protein